MANQYYLKNKEKYAAANLRWRNKYPDHYKLVTKKRRDAIRIEALAVYGSICNCCGEKEKMFLAFDHINHGRGNPAKRMTNNRSWHVFIIKNKPKDIQILCHNCNIAKNYYGECPHVKAL